MSSSSKTPRAPIAADSSLSSIKALGRRSILRQGLVAAGVLAVSPALWGASNRGSPRAAQPLTATPRISNIPKLANTLHEAAVENDPATRMMIPRGFSVREVARSGHKVVSSSSFTWHNNPDGGATFAAEDGGWIYVSNSEIKDERGGVGALRFDKSGRVVDGYSICEGTSNNCAGGATPWGTWLSCEEVSEGLVYECDPSGRQAAQALPALGAFRHEAAAIDPVGRCIYLTEDDEDGKLYRFIPDHYPAGGRADLTSGRLEVAVVAGENLSESRPVAWRQVPNPLPWRIGKHHIRLGAPTRNQVKEATTFNGGEGCWYHQDIVYFTTKGDRRVWALDVRRNTLDLIYGSPADALSPAVDVDNVTVSPTGDILVAEDGSNMRLVVVGADMQAFELLRVIGQDLSEICGPAFSPDGRHLYFSSQKGVSGEGSDGRTYQLTGPFFKTA